MKEAAGEANLTVITIILIAVVVAVATPLISSLMKTTSNRACCTDAGGIWKGSCTDPGNGQYSEEAYSQCLAEAEAGGKSSGK